MNPAITTLASSIASHAQAAGVTTVSTSKRNQCLLVYMPHAGTATESPLWSHVWITSAFLALSLDGRRDWLARNLGREPQKWEIVEKAISLHTPWPWAIFHAGKDIENRTRKMCRPGWYFMHVARHEKQDEHDTAAQFINDRRSGGEECPPIGAHQRGGIVGAFQLLKWEDDSPSVWYMGHKAAKIGAKFELPFIPCPGSQGVFQPVLS